MGAGYARYDYSPITVGSPDTYGKSNSIMRVVRSVDYYFLFIYLSTDTQLYDVPFIEYLNGGVFEINGTNLAPQDIDVCVIDSYKACPTLIKSVIDMSTGKVIPLSKIYFENPGSACWTYRYRLGSLVTDASSFVVPQTAESGFKCRISVRDFKETELKESSCCRATHINFGRLDMNQRVDKIYQDFTNLSLSEPVTCPMTFSNGYTSDHCDNFMNNFCKGNSDNEPCIMFMLAQIDRKKQTLQTFIDYCSTNLSSRVCLYMALSARLNGQSEVPDRALRQYCSTHSNDKKCACYNTYTALPSSFNQNSYIGPVACWYKPCAEETNLQFLLTEQLQQRKGCSITRCSIDINNINITSANPSMITLINDCNVSLKSRTSLPKTEKTFFSDPVWKMSYMGLMSTSLATTLLFVPLILNKT